MPDETQVTVVPEEAVDLTALEIATNHEFTGTPPASETAPEPEAATPPVETEVAPQPETPVAEGQSETLTDDEKALLTEIRSLKELEGLPYKSLPEFFKGYKNIQGEFTKVREKTKPFEAVLDRMSRDPQYANLVQQAQALLDNPQLLQAYQGQIAPGDPRPNPTQFNVYEPEGFTQYEKALDSWTQRQLDARINARLGQVEQNARLDNFKREFKAKFPEAEDADTLLQWASTVMTSFNPFEIAHKVKNWDNVQGQIESRVRKELTDTLKKASETKTPTGSPASKPQPTTTEILNHITRFGGEATKQRYGEKAMNEALKQSF